MSKQFRFDEIGYWSEIKLDIIKNYAAAYSKILTAQEKPALQHAYIDAFSGAGIHISKTTGDYVEGSPLNALLVQPPFREYFFVDLDGKKVKALQDKVGGKKNVHIYEGDCNHILLNEIFPKIQHKDYKRGLCLLDPYGLHLHWKIIETAGKMGSIEIFLNFPVADMNRNVLWHNPEGVDIADIARMNNFWGDDSWKSIAYTKERNLFGFEEKTDIETVVDGFKSRLKKVAEFNYIPTPLPMRNTNGAIVYYLFFASPNKTGNKIVTDIFNKYRKRGLK